MMDVLSPREAVETVKRYMNDLRLPFSVSYGEPKGDPAEVHPQSYSVPIELKRKDGASFTATANVSKAKVFETPAVSAGVSSLKKVGAESFSSQKSQGISGGISKIIKVVVVIVALASVAAAVFLYVDNKKLADQVVTLTTEGITMRTAASGVSTQLTNLTASKQEVDKQLSDALKETNQLRSELSFFLPLPQGGTFTLKGALSMDDRGQYALTTANGLRVAVKNSKDAKVDSNENLCTYH